MPGINLTSAEAAERSKNLKIHHYQVDLDVTKGAETFYSKCVVTFSATPGSKTFIDACAKKVISAKLNGKDVDVSNYDGESIFLTDLAAENELVIELDAIYSKTGEGLHRFVDPADNEVYLYSQHQVADTRRTFASFDQPDLKATYSFSVIAPGHWEVISNGPVESVAEINGSKHWKYKKTQKFSTYLTCFVAGPYHKVEDIYKGEKEVPLGIYCRKSLAPHLDADEIFKITKQGFAFYEKEFGLAYPFDKYDQLAVAEFNAGAMENVGCVTFAEDYFVFRSKVTDKNYNWRANVILHEMAHMWFGDLVTMQWWDDIWLNESFAEWASYYTAEKATRFKNSWTVFNSERKNWAYRQDQLSSTHPIAVDMDDLEAVKNNFDGITYAKGASVLQQLVWHVGKENFLAGLRKYFSKHAWGNTKLRDLLVELEETSGRDLTPWVKTWLQTAGVNTFQTKVELAGENYKSISIVQEAPKIPAGSTELRPHRMAIGLYDLSGSKLIRRKSVELDVAGNETNVPDLVGEKIADLILVNDHDYSYGKIRFDEKSLNTLSNHLGDIEDPLTRALCWSATWDMHRDGELSASKYVPMVLKAIGKETDVAVVAMTLGQLETAVEIYAADANRAKLRQLLSDSLWELLNKCEPGSDMQLQFARNFANAAIGEAIEKVRDLLDGKLAGLVVDADLRWHFLCNLVEKGNATAAEIDAEAKSDNTANGKKSEAFARAAFADKSIKSETFNSIMNDDLSNHILLSKIRGLMRPTQRELYEPFVDQYFANVLNIWETKSYETGRTIGQLLFPTYLVNETTLSKTNNWLNGIGKDAPGGLKRIMNENRDSLLRALNAQRSDS